MSGSFASLAGQSFSFDYDYDASGRLTQRKISSPFSSELFTTNYTFDAANRLDVISQSGPMAQPKGIDLVYGVFGQMDTPGRLGAGGRLIEAYRYNSATVPASPDSTVGSKTHYKYTPEGQVSDVIHRQGDETHIRTHAYWYTPQETLRIWFARSAADSW